jgi:hypothetical protein
MSWNRMTPNQSLFSSRMTCSVAAATSQTCSIVVAGHFDLDLGQHARHSAVALGMAAELTLRAESMDGRAKRGNGDGHHNEKSFPEPVGLDPGLSPLGKDRAANI